MAFDLNVNGTRHTIDADPAAPLLWVIRASYWADWHEVQLRNRTVWRVYSARRRPTDTVLQCRCEYCRRQKDHDDRRGLAGR